MQVSSWLKLQTDYATIVFHNCMPKPHRDWVGSRLRQLVNSTFRQTNTRLARYNKILEQTQPSYRPWGRLHDLRPHGYIYGFMIWKKKIGKTKTTNMESWFDYRLNVFSFLAVLDGVLISRCARTLPRRSPFCTIKNRKDSYMDSFLFLFGPCERSKTAWIHKWFHVLIAVWMFSQFFMYLTVFSFLALFEPSPPIFVRPHMLMDKGSAPWVGMGS